MNPGAVFLMTKSSSVLDVSEDRSLNLKCRELIELYHFVFGFSKLFVNVERPTGSSTLFERKASGGDVKKIEALRRIVETIDDRDPELSVFVLPRDLADSIVLADAVESDEESGCRLNMICGAPII
jgi:hypothetical protein